jgi:hypothetical protein
MAMRWVIWLLLLVVGRLATGSRGRGGRGRGGTNAAVSWLGCGTLAEELSFPGVKKTVGELLSETSLRSGCELLSGFVKLGTEGLEDRQLGVVPSTRSRARSSADPVIETGRCSKMDGVLVRAAPSVAAAVKAALIGEDGV